MIPIFQKQNIQQTFAYLLMLIIMLMTLSFHVVPAILAGLLGYTLTKGIMQKIQIKIPKNKIIEKFIGIFVGIISFALLGILIFITIKALNGENLSGLLKTITETLNESKKTLPPIIASYIPDSINEIKITVIDTLKTHINSFANIGKEALNGLLFVIIGWIIGILVACKNDRQEKTEFSKTWCTLWFKLNNAFKYVVFAQVKVATFNSIIMGIFLFIIAPIFDWNIPYSKMLILITFVCGLLPIVGNLISNTITFLMALTVSLPAALASLVMLMLIHKLEYLIISKSLGADIDSDIWELLIILFSFEILFGVAGMVFAPICYAFIKAELKEFKWI